MRAKLTQKEVLDRCISTHGDFYDYSKVNYIDRKTKIEIICKKENHGSFWQYARDHFVGHGCKPCASEKSAASIKIDKKTVLERFHQTHGDKYDYSEIGDDMNCRGLLKIICKIENHPPFYQTTTQHYIHGCHECANKTVSEKLKADPDDILERIKIVHNSFYDYSLFVYPSDRTKRIKSIIICPKENHGQFLQTAGAHLRGQGCPTCAIERSVIRLTSNKEEFLEKAYKLYTPEQYTFDRFIYTKAIIPSIITCVKHNIDFEQSPSRFLAGQLACKLCSTSKTTSDGSIDWLDSLEIPNDKQHREVYLKLEKDRWPIRVDGYMPETNTVYEYLGDFWHGNPANPNYLHHEMKPKSGGLTFGDIYKNTLDRENRIKSAGFNLITIWESDWLAMQSRQTVQQEHSPQH